MDWKLVTGFGALLVVAATGLMYSHYRHWQKEKLDPELDERGLAHYARRFRRRMQSSALLLLIGVAFPLSEVVIPWDQMEPKTRAYGMVCFWGAVFLMVAWMVFLALGDMLSTATQARASMARMKAQQRELQDELTQLRRKGSNGHRNN